MTQHVERETTLRLDCSFSVEQLKLIDKRLHPYQSLYLKAYKHNKKHQIPKGVNSIQKIVKIIDISNNNPDFLPILGINLQEAQEHHLYLAAMIVPETITSLRTLAAMKEKGECSEQLESLVIFLRERWKELAKNYHNELSWFQEDCYDVYLQKQSQTYKAVIGLNNFRLSHSHNSTKDLQQLFGHQTNINVSLPFPNQSLPNISFPQIQSPQSLAILHSFFAKYAENMCYFLQESLNFGLTRRIYEDRLLNDTQIESISMIDRRTGDKFQSEIYHNFYCKHFQGNTLQTFEQMQECPFCGSKMVYDKEEMQIISQDVFQEVLLNNFMNRDKQDVDYYFKNHVFTLKKAVYKQRFSGYHHFQMYVKRCKEEKRRGDISVINQHENIPLYNRLKRLQKLYSLDQLIDCPVRGKFCKHWQFYDLRRVYSALMDSNDEYFECFVCCKEVHFQEILYLKEMKQIIKLAQLFAESKELRKNLSASLKIDHQFAKAKLVISSETKTHQLQLNVYQTMKKPLSKSRYDIQYFQQHGIQLPASFLHYFYGH